MKKIDGLRIDYELAAGDLVLPPEFLGQPAGRQLAVLGHWLAAVLTKRDQVAGRLAPAIKAAHEREHAVKSLDELLDSGASVIAIATHPRTRRKAVFCITSPKKPHEPTKKTVLEQVHGSGGYRKLFERNVPGSPVGFKNVKREARGLLDDWLEWAELADGDDRITGISYQSFVNSKHCKDLETA